MVGAARDIERNRAWQPGSHLGWIFQRRIVVVTTAAEQQQRCEMRTQITEQEFFDRANQMAQEDKSYEPGSKIQPTANGYELIGSWMGTETLVRAINGLYQGCYVKGKD